MWLLFALIVGLVFILVGEPDRGPLPHSDHTNTAPAPDSPDELVDARQQQ